MRRVVELERPGLVRVRAHTQLVGLLQAFSELQLLEVLQRRRDQLEKHDVFLFPQILQIRVARRRGDVVDHMVRGLEVLLARLAKSVGRIAEGADSCSLQPSLLVQTAPLMAREQGPGGRGFATA